MQRGCSEAFWIFQRLNDLGGFSMWAFKNGLWQGQETCFLVGHFVYWSVLFSCVRLRYVYRDIVCKVVRPVSMMLTACHLRLEAAWGLSFWFWIVGLLCLETMFRFFFLVIVSVCVLCSFVLSFCPLSLSLSLVFLVRVYLSVCPITRFRLESSFPLVSFAAQDLWVCLIVSSPSRDESLGS